MRRKYISYNIVAGLAGNFTGKSRKLVTGLYETDRRKRKEIDRSVFIKLGL